MKRYWAFLSRAVLIPRLYWRADMALTIYTSKDNQWREYVNPLRGLTLERIVSLIEQGERGAFADLQWFYQTMERSDTLNGKRA